MDKLHIPRSGSLIFCCVGLLMWAGQAFSAERVVLKGDQTFSQIFLKVDSDDTVRFVNHDTVTHVLSFKGTKTALSFRKIPPGSSRAIKFSTPGVYDVQCQEHPDMKLTMFVSFVDKVVSN